MMARSQHVREGEQGRHQGIVLPDGQDEERPVRQRHAHRFGLCSGHVNRAEEPSVDARRVESLMAENAGAVGKGERHHDDVADLEGVDALADGLDHADRLVAHATAGLARLRQLVRPEIAPADAGAADGDERVGRLDQAGVWDVFDSNVSGAVQDGCAHRDLPLRIHIVYPGFLYSFAGVSTMSGL